MLQTALPTYNWHARYEDSKRIRKIGAWSTDILITSFRQTPPSICLFDFLVENAMYLYTYIVIPLTYSAYHAIFRLSLCSSLKRWMDDKMKYEDLIDEIPLQKYFSTINEDWEGETEWGHKFHASFLMRLSHMLNCRISSMAFIYWGIWRSNLARAVREKCTRKLLSTYLIIKLKSDRGRGLQARMVAALDAILSLGNSQNVLSQATWIIRPGVWDRAFLLTGNALKWCFR